MSNGSGHIKIALLHSTVRREEKLLLEAFARHQGVDVDCIDDRVVTFVPAARDASAAPRYDGVVARSVSYSRNLYARRLYEASGLRCFNDSKVAAICGDKLQTSLALSAAGVPQPELRVAFTEQAALETLEEMGYPVVLKPIVGSWGRLIARADDRDAAESLLEHKAALGNYLHQIYYLQRYVEKGDCDIRSFVVGDTCIAAIRRTGSHWRTNTARGATVQNQPVNDQLSAISLEAAEAVGGGMLAIDLFETNDGYLVNEVNDTMEFKNSIEPTGVDIPQAVADYVVSRVRDGVAA